MAFVILSARNLAASPVRTVTARRIAVLSAGLLLITLIGGAAGGLALGIRVGEERSTAATGTATGTLDPTRPENQVLISRVGSLSARLLRLESEALTLARRVGVMGELERRPQSATENNESEPRGGPLVAPLDAPDTEVPPDIRSGLARLDSGLDSIDATFALVTRRTAASDLAGMAFPSRYPIAGARISSGFGNRRDPFTRRLARHTGVDLPAPLGTPILASAGGTVRFAGYRRAYGNAVEIDHGAGLVTRYAHASTVLVRTGQVVLPDQAVATVGSTGRSTGPHLHFEVMQDGAHVQPLRYLGSRVH